MLAFPVAKLENVRTNHQAVPIPLVPADAAPVPLAVIFPRRQPKSRFQRPVLSFHSSEFNRQIRGVERPVTYRKYRATTCSNRQKIQKCACEFFTVLVPLRSANPFHSPRGKN